MEGLWAAEGDSTERVRTLPAGVKYFSPFVQFGDLLQDFIQFTARVHISVHLQVTGHITSAFCSSPNFPDSSSLGFQVKQSQLGLPQVVHKRINK